MADDGALYYEGRICVPGDATLKRIILKKTHSTPYVDHPGRTNVS